MNTDIEEEPRLKRKPTTSSARPRRMSEVDIHDNKKPIPDATSLFIFSKTNRLGAGERRRIDASKLLDVFRQPILSIRSYIICRGSFNW